MKEPLPLHEDISIDEDLRRDLANVRGLSAPPFAFDRGLEALKTSIAQPDASSGRGSAIARSGVWRIVAGATVLCVGAALVARLSSSGEPSAPIVSAAPTAVGAEEPRPAVRDEAPPREEAPVTSPGALPDAPARSAPPAARSVTTPGAQPSSSSASTRIHEELVHMRKLRELAASDPAAALAMADEGQRRFGAGVFTQEREVVAIEALRRLGRNDAAKLRASRFLEEHPESPFVDKVRLLSQ